MKRILLLLLLLAAVAHIALAQDITHILAAIEQNNLRLRAAREAAAADIADLQAANNIFGTTSIEYSPFFHRGVRGLASSELIISQEFEVPRLYRERQRAIELRLDVDDAEYRILRRDILLEAAKLCYDLDFARRNSELIQQRIAAADTLLAIFQRRLDHGHATIMDFNRIRMDRIALNTEAAECQGNIMTILRGLETLNGSQPLPTDSLLVPREASYAATSVDNLQLTATLPVVASSPVPPLSAISSHDDESVSAAETLETRAAEASLAASQHEVRLARKSWYPTFTAGFRRNTDLREANGGFLVGVALPLASNGKKQRAARLHRSAAELQLANARTEAEARRRTLLTEAENLRRTLATYDTDFLNESLAVMLRAVVAGEITITDYYTETRSAYLLLQQRLTTENSLAKVMAELYRDNL